MSLKKVTLASLILLSLTACSGGGGSSAPVAKNDKKPTVQQPAKHANKAQDDAKKAEADRLAKQKAEEERLKKEEADRLAKQKAEEERLKKEEADRLAKQNAQDEANRAVREKAKQEKFKESVFYKIFLKEDIVKEGFNPKLGEENTIETSIVDGEKYKEYSYSSAYDQVYSLVIGNYKKQSSLKKEEETFNQVRAYGLNTLKENIPMMGKAVYSGIGFHKDQSGKLTYNVDFDKKVGVGEIVDLAGFGKIELKEGKIEMDVDNSAFIRSQATSQATAMGEYKSQFFGDKAQEIGGVVTLPASNGTTMSTNGFSKFEVGFGGTRGEITK